MNIATLKTCISGNFESDLIILERFLQETDYLKKGGSFTSLYDELGYDSYDTLEKAIDKSKLVKKLKLIHRGGKSFFATYWVNPVTGEKTDNTKEELSYDYSGAHDEFAAGDTVEYFDKKTGRYRKGKIKKIKTSAKYPDGIAEIDDEGRHVAVGLKSAKPIKLIDSTTGVKEEKDKTTPTEKIKPLKDAAVLESSDDLKNILDLSSGVSLGGSSGVMLYKSSKTDGKYTVKKAHKGELEQLENELLADKIYQLYGFFTPGGSIRKMEGKDVKMSRFIDDMKQLGSVEASKKKEVYEKISEGFVLDALLANWDVAGASEDNILVATGAGSATAILRVDNGGSMFFRAKGGKKDFGAEITELKTLRDLSKNPVTGKIYASVDDDKIMEQAIGILDRRSELEALINKTGKTAELEAVKKRLDWLRINIVDKKTRLKETEPTYDTKKYSSKATADFFENGWDTLTVEGNPEIKDTIKKRILLMEKERHATYTEYAKNHGLTVEEYKKQAQKKVEQWVGESDFFRATGVQYLENILLKDKRFKSQFETKSSEGSFTPTGRAETEHSYFGFVKSVAANKEKRPIYGYFSNSKNGVINSAGTNPPPDSVRMYGRVKIKIKKEVAMRKATVTQTDSLGSTDSLNAVFAAKPHFTMVGRWSDPLKLTESSKASTYTEAQYHNQLTIDDIEEIIFSTKNYHSEEEGLLEMNKMVAIARKTSIPIRFY